MGSTSIDLLLSDDDRGLRTYNVNFYDDILIVTVTHITSVVDNWIRKIEEFHHESLEALIVGLDIDRPSNNPLAILKLCVDRNCLIFQFWYAEAEMPESLIRFLDNRHYTFVGVRTRDHVHWLYKDYGLNVRANNVIDLRELAVVRIRGDRGWFANLELIDLAFMFLAGKVIEKRRDILMSNWCVAFLSEAQVQYACIDAFLCFEIGRVLMCGRLVDELA